MSRIGFTTFLPGAASAMRNIPPPHLSYRHSVWGSLPENMAPRQDPCQESSSVRQIRTAVIWRTPSPFSSYRQGRKSQSTVLFPCGPRANSLPRDRLRFRISFRWQLHGHNAPKRANGEKPVPAGSTSIRGKVKQPEQPREAPGPMLGRNSLEIHVPAHRAMREPFVGDGNSPGIKAEFTTAAAPGAEQRDPH